MFRFGKKEAKRGEYQDITFIARNEFIDKATTPPVPAKTLLPEWYKNIPPHHTKDPNFMESHGNHNSTMKQCMPFFDSWTFGYMMLTPCDIIVERGFDGNNIKVHSHEMFSLIGERGGPGKHSMPIPEDYYQFEFTWQTHWEAKTPKGYSSLYTHPINRPDLPFYTISGVMDTDSWYITGNHPFFIKKGFEGIIPTGTPMMSIVPFKRDMWKSSHRAIEPMEHDLLQSKVRRHASGGYRKEMWSRKEFL